MNKQIDIQVSPVVELIVAMYRLANFNRDLNQNNDHRVNRNEDIDLWLKQLSNKLDDEMKNELEVFFNKESYFAILLIPFAFKENVFQSVNEFFKAFEKMKVDDLLNGFMNTGFNPNYVEFNYDNTDEILEHIRKLNLPEEEKWKLFYLVYDGETTKKRLLRLVKDFYKQHFEIKEKVIMESQKAFAGRIDQEDPQVVKLLQNYGALIDGKPAVIFPSYVLDAGIIMAMIMTDKPLVCVLGSNYLSHQAKQQDEKEILELMKVLTDERRFQLLQMLSKRPYYGFELAQKLGVSNSTISHHLSTLLNHQLIESKRNENKIFYKVNKSEINSILKQFQSFFS